MEQIDLIIQFKKSADHIYLLKDYTSATVIYFKTWFAIYDHIISNKLGIIPKDHSDRFRILQKDFPNEYILLDMEFNTCRSTYNKIINFETCNRIKKIIENEIINHKIS